jgi:hypothetical protein
MTDRFSSRLFKAVTPDQRTGQVRSGRLQWSIAAFQCLPNELSPAATSAPIAIPGCQKEEADDFYSDPYIHQPAHINLQGHMPKASQPTRGRIHHRLDNVTDYHWPGTHCWEYAQKEHCKQADKEAGRILIGQWPPTKPWKEQDVVRKDVDFRKEEQDRWDWLKQVREKEMMNQL